MCENSQAKAKLYMIVLHDDRSLSVYIWPELDELKKAVREGLDRIRPVYRYIRLDPNDPPPYD